MHRTLFRSLSLALGLGALTATLVVSACDGAGECGEDGVEVDYLGGSRDGDSHCAVRPAVCSNPASCDDDMCRGAMYGLCDAGYIGVACSSNFAPPIISCNPDN